MYAQHLQRDGRGGAGGGSGGWGGGSGRWGGGGGRGGGGGGRGGGGGKGWAPSRSRLLVDGIEVQTNAFKLTAKNLVTINQYQLQMEPCRFEFDSETRKPKGVVPVGRHLFVNTDGDGSSSQPEIDDEEARKRNRSSPLFRRILNQLQQKLQNSRQFFVHDGSNIAYSPRELRPIDPDPNDPPLLVLADSNDPVSKKRKAEDPDQLQYLVFVNVESDEVGDKSGRHQWFLVSFMRTSTFSYEQSKLMQATLNTALRNTLMQPPSLLWALGRSPHLFFFPPKQYSNALPGFLQSKVQSAIMPMLGLKPSIRSVENQDSFLMLADFGLSYAYNDEAPTTERSPRVKKPFFPFLHVDANGNSATLAGTDVRISNVHAVIPPAMRDTIKEALHKRILHLRYDKGPRNWQKLQGMQQKLLKEQQQAKSDYVSADVPPPTAEGNVVVRKPWTDAELEEMRFRTRRNIRLADDVNDPIIWEPHTHTFPYCSRKPKEGEVQGEHVEPEHVTVVEYFWRHYEYRLKYPNMPLLHIASKNSKIKVKEYFPFEFFFQARTEVKGMNSEQNVRDALQLHDLFSGAKRIEKVASLIKEVNPADTLRMQFEIALSENPITVQAKVLSEPMLFQQNQLEIQDGSWKLPGHYVNPSTLASFAVIDYSSAPEGALWGDCFKDLFHYSRERGIIFSNDISPMLFDQVTVRAPWQPDLAGMYEHFQRAISKARSVFLSERRGVWDVHNSEGAIERCAVKLDEVDGQYAYIWRQNRLGDIPERVPVERVNCPSIVFVVFPEKNSGQYSNVKYFSDCEFHLQSQCLLWGKRKDKSYYANVAQKLNTKLATATGRSKAWRLKENAWLKEVPTMVMGLSTASGLGKDGKMTVVGTVCLDDTGLTMFQELRVQSKGPFIAQTAMIEIVQVLATMYSVCNGGRIPERVVVYRLGGDDGMFEDIIGKEVAAIKKAFHELNTYMKDYSCVQCSNSGCVFCLPKITMIIAQHQHNLILVPKNSDSCPTNVPSGTCVEGIFAGLTLSDDAKMEGLLSANKCSQEQAPHQCFPSNGKSNAFALVAHGGLKGTSKSVIYQWIWNENLLFKPKSSDNVTPLTLDRLEELTYFLSFQYGTANKAPRLPALLQYSARLNNVAIGYVHLRCDQQNNNSYALQRSLEESVYMDTTGKAQILRRSKLHDFVRRMPFHPHSSG